MGRLFDTLLLRSGVLWDLLKGMTELIRIMNRLDSIFLIRGMSGQIIIP